MNKGSHVFQVDADMTFAPDTLERLLQTSEQHPNAVITGLGFMGYPPYQPAIFDWPHMTAKPRPIASWPERPFEIGACGSFGFLIPAHILLAIGAGRSLISPTTSKAMRTRRNGNCGMTWRSANASVTQATRSSAIRA